MEDKLIMGGTPQKSEVHLSHLLLNNQLLKKMYIFLSFKTSYKTMIPVTPHLWCRSELLSLLANRSWSLTDTLLCHGIFRSAFLLQNNKLLKFKRVYNELIWKKNPILWNQKSTWVTTVHPCDRWLTQPHVLWAAVHYRSNI